jgi:hypothetical protein
MTLLAGKPAAKYCLAACCAGCLLSATSSLKCQETSTRLRDVISQKVVLLMMNLWLEGFKIEILHNNIC